MNIEYESTASFDLRNVAITIPLPALAQAPQVNQVSCIACQSACGELYCVIAPAFWQRPPRPTR